MEHQHSIYDNDTHFVIDLKTREIKNDIGKTVIVQNDHNSERFSFELPKEIEGHDMSLCNVVQVHYVNIDSKTKEQHEGLYEVDDLQISPDSDDVVILSWLLSQNATRAIGSLYFGIVFKCIEEDGTLTYSWHTTVNKDFKVVESLDNSNVILEENPDILAQFEARLAALEENGGGGDFETPGFQNYLFGTGLIEDTDGYVSVDFEQVASADHVPISADVIGNTMYFRSRVESPLSTGNMVLFEVDLPENTGGGGGFTVDGTLTQDGTAADAKTVGEKFAYVDESIENLENSLLERISDLNSTIYNATEKVNGLEETINDNTAEMESLQEQWTGYQEQIADEMATLDSKIPNVATVENNILKMQHKELIGTPTTLFEVELPKSAGGDGTTGNVEVPTKTSQLENDSGFVKTQDLDELSDEIAVERARITNLSTLSDGSTTGDAELIDARVGSDGTIYDNVGEAVRNQVSNITEMFTFETSSNLFNFDTATANKKLDFYTGELTADDHKDYYVTDFIPTEYGKSYIATAWLDDTEYSAWAASKVIFYDENKQYLGISSTGLNNGVTISKTDAKYFRTQFQCAFGTRKVYLGEGTTKPETFIPYINKKVIKEEHLSITDDAVIADHTISSIKLKDLEEHKLVPFELAENLYNYENRIDGKQYRNGELIDATNGCVSDKIPAEANTVYTIGVLWRDEWYYEATKFAYCFDENNEWLGQVNTTNGVFTTLEKTKFISVFISYAAVPDWYREVCLVKGDKLPTTFVPYSGKMYKLNPDYISYVTKYISAWKDKKFVSYGDSITQQNLWQPYVRNYFEMEHACRGVGGSGFVRGVSHYYANADGSYNNKYTTGSTAPEGTTLCEACLCSDERIALSIPEDADLILIAGGTNDHGGDATSVPELGEISYTIVDGEPVFDTTTFKNAVCATVYKIMKRCPEAIVMLMTPCNTRGMNQVQTVNGNGLELLDYAHAIKECAEYMSIPCIDVYGESGLNQFNMKLNGDNLHPDDAGARKMARAVIAKLKAYEPRKTVFGW